MQLNAVQKVSNVHSNCTALSVIILDPRVGQTKKINLSGIEPLLLAINGISEFTLGPPEVIQLASQIFLVRKRIFYLMEGVQCDGTVVCESRILVRIGDHHLLLKLTGVYQWRKNTARQIPDQIIR